MKNIFALFTMSVLVSTTLVAQEYNFEASLVIQQMSGDKTFLEADRTISLEVPAFMSYGFQTGMNIGRFNMGIDFLFGNSEVISEHNFEVAVSCFDAAFEYSFLAKPLSPLVSTGIGSVTYSDSFTSVETLNESDFSYFFGGGLKWIISEKFYVKPMYRLTFSKIEATTNTMFYHGFHLGLGYIFNMNKTLSSK